MLEIVVALLGTIVGSISSSSVILHFVKRHDRVEELIEKNNRIAEGLALMSECQMMVLDALHEKGIVNGNGTEMKKKINSYMMKNTNNGYRVDI